MVQSRLPCCYHPQAAGDLGVMGLLLMLWPPAGECHGLGAVKIPRFGGAKHERSVWISRGRLSKYMVSRRKVMRSIVPAQGWSEVSIQRSRPVRAGGSQSI